MQEEPDASHPEPRLFWMILAVSWSAVAHSPASTNHVPWLELGQGESTGSAALGVMLEDNYRAFPYP